MKCQKKLDNTEAREAVMKGSSITGTHPSLLHGCVDEPIPIWSHIYGGAWFNLKLERGDRISEDVMARAKKAVEAAGGPPPAVEPEVAKRVRTKKTVVAAATAATATTATAAEAPAAVAATPAPATAPKPRVTKKTVQPKAAAAAAAPGTTVQPELPKPVARVKSKFPSEVEEVLRIPVRPITIDGRSYVWNSATAKVYTASKFQYAGRYDSKASQLDTTFPDSDAEA